MGMYENFQTPNLAVLKAALNALANGVVLAARNGQVVYMNAAARRYVQAGNALRLHNNRVFPVDPGAARVLAAALKGMDANGGKAAGRSSTFALPDRDGAGVLVTILPINREDAQGEHDPSEATAAIFIQDPSVVPVCPGEAFAKLYGLTNGELRVALALMPGLRVHQVASALGISLETVRTHLQHIFQKTGTSRQADLLGLMWRSSGPVAAT